MTLRPLLPAILLALVMSVVVAVLAAGRGSSMTLALAAALFVLQILFAMVRANAPLWRTPPEPADDPGHVVCVWRNAILAGWVYAWSAVAMLAIYSLSNLVWRHWWQYGAAMALVAAGIFLYARLLEPPRSALRARAALDALMGLTALQGLAMTGVLLYLVFWGKLASRKVDWAANYIFAAGSLTLAILSLVAVLTYRRRARAGSDQANS